MLLAIHTASLGQSWYYFEGHITHLNGDLPIENHPVFIDSYDSILLVTLTDSSGYYIDSVFFSQNIPVTVKVFVEDCNNEIHFQEFNPPNQTNTANFSICNFNIQCDAFFYYNYDFNNYMIIEFINLSEGSIDNWFWDFDDGSFSSEINPIHEYSEVGVYNVLLTVTDSSANCTSSFTMQVIVGEESECIASFSHIVSYIDPLRLHFFDESYGNISQWNWDFGDGSFSDEQSPFHIYAEAGFYNVCLTVSDSLSLCNDSFCLTILVEDSINCEADFKVTLDSLNNTPYSYIFSDNSVGTISNWMWDFGDGSFSTEQNPIHTYDNAGVYEVCLLISTDSVQYQCSDFYCETISTQNYYNFGGHAFIGDYTINIDENDSSNIAYAYLYRKIANQWKYMDMREFWRFGYYWFVDKLEGDYLIRLDLKEGSTDYENYSPSYLEHSTDWRRATTFNLSSNDQFAVNINLQKLSSLTSGVGNISGHILAGESCDQELDIERRLIKLFDNEDNYVAFVYTDEMGYFEFLSLGQGTYKIQAEVTGKISSIGIADINSSNPFSEDHILEIACNSYVGINENENIEKGIEVQKIYPIPANEYIKILMQSNSKQSIIVEFIDLMGRVEVSISANILEGSTLLNIDVSDINTGLYIYRIKTEDNVLIGNGKLLVE